MSGLIMGYGLRTTDDGQRWPLAAASRQNHGLNAVEASPPVARRPSPVAPVERS